MTLGRGEECVHERGGGPRHQIVRVLPPADELDRKLELLGDREDGAALRRAVELRHDQSGYRGGRGELTSLLDRVRAGGAIQDEEHFVRCPLWGWARHADDLAELVHEV